MSKSVLAILDHYSSTIENPLHSNCPDGESSWCSYNRDKALNTNFHRPIKNALRPAVRQVMLPLFDRLSSVPFLEGCKECYTQNPNESLHHIIWSMSPKECYNSPHETSLAISLGVCQFNNGFVYTMTKMFEQLDIPIFPSMLSIWKKIDNIRVEKANHKELNRIKLRRKELKRSSVKKQDAFQRVEGTYYQSGSFFPSDHRGRSTRGRGPGRTPRGRGRGRTPHGRGYRTVLT